MRLGVAATGPLGADVLERLADRRAISFLLTRPDRRQGRGRKVAAPPAKTVAERRGIPVLQPERLEPGIQLAADVVVVVAYGVLVPAPLLDRVLWLNVHPSLLPRWRGAAPVERALMAGDAETGVTVIRLVQELDAGPIAAQRAFPVSPDDDAGAVYEKAAPLAVERPIHVRVRARDELGEPILVEASGLEARVIQHEIDHLDGVLILDRTSRDERKQAMRVLRDSVPASLGSAAA